MNASSNIGIYHPRVFCERPGTKQSYALGYHWGLFSSLLHREVKGRTFWVKVNNPKQEIRLIISNQIIGLLKSDQRIKLIRLNQSIWLVQFSQDIQSWHIGRCSIMAMEWHSIVTLDQDTHSCLEILFDSWGRSITLTHGTGGLGIWGDGASWCGPGPTTLRGRTGVCS